MHEKRLTVRLLNYWQTLRGDADLPSYTRFNHNTISDIWGQCIVLHVQPSAGDKHLYVYEHCGRDIATVVGRDLRGEQLVGSAKIFPGSKIVRRIDEVASGQLIEPLYDEGQFVNEESKIIKFRACLMPFTAPTSDKVSHVLVGVSWRAF